MGAHFYLTIKSLPWEKIEELLSGMTVFTADAHQGTACWDADFLQPTALIISSEAHGPGEQARAVTDQWVHIPMPGRSESLNAGVALSVLLFEVVRQRSPSTNSPETR
jgi:TrmH family RNA methyltransferase